MNFRAQNSDFRTVLHFGTVYTSTEKMTKIIFLQRIDGVTVGGDINSWNCGEYGGLVGMFVLEVDDCMSVKKL